MMIKFPSYAFITGLYFSTLQFCFLILLQINISSAYLTYMIITGSWLAGSLVGLWMRSLNRHLGVGLGLFCFYGVYALVTHLPFSGYTLAFSALGAGLAGLWAGQFFIFLLSQYKEVDRLFFHENNGFLLGIIIFFVGFTMLGREFVFWAPMALAGLLLLNHTWIKEHSKPGQ
ncbi:MAG: hypothetical protein HOJ49_00630 [Nitrospina sp.]|jgi:hypothetical protein|nr:hypothetical protein [Nitrospina sp.]